MKLRNFFASAVVAAFALAGCQEEEQDLGTPDITISTNELKFEVEGGEQTLTVNATRDWKVETDADWVVVDPESGEASSDDQTVTVTVLENTGMDRSADLKFTIGMKSKYLTVSQAGPGGSAEALVVYFNDYDKEEATKTYGSSNGSWPYLDQFDGWKNATGTGAANVTYSFKGMSARANSTSDGSYSDYAGSGKNNMFFGANAYLATKSIALNGAKDFTLTFGTDKYSQDTNIGSVFTKSEFRIYLSNDGAKWVELTDYSFAGDGTEGRWNIATANFSVPEGTETLSICMEVSVASVYRMDDLKLVISEGGETVDFTQGVEKDFGAGGSTGGGTTPEGTGEGTQTSPYDAAKAHNVAATLADGEKITGVYVKGKITEIKEVSTSYGNATYYITDATGAAKFYVYRGYALGNVKFTSEDEIKVGDEVLVYGDLMNYKGNSPQLGQGNYIVELNGGAGDGGNDPEPELPGVGEGTQASPYDAVKAHNVAATLADGEKITGVYVKGKISEIKEVSTSYGNATYYITDATGAAKFYVYRGYALGNVKFTSEDEIKVGDEVLVYGDLMNYMGNSPQLGTGNYIVELNSGSGGGGEEPEPEDPVDPSEVQVVTVADFLAAAEDETVYELTGTITRIAVAYDSQYNNITYYIADETGETYVYRMSCEGVADPLSLTAGDEITVQGKRSSYNGVAQMAQGGKYISHVDKAAPAPEAGTYTLDFADVANRTSFTTSEQIWEQNGIKLTNNKASSTSNVADYSAPARFYKSTSLKIEKEGMNKMVFLCNSGKNTGPADLKASVTDANATVTVEGMTVTITFATSVDVFEIATLAGQVRVDLLTVYAE